ncbi:uncharacterized protein [Dasypus novemcinctus]|uniref:uncharacterized protein isoform X2 n=1 Tax=Dasypus novemcinctus TaxID=9361 RepID=UPI00265F7502|nr:uncharacterized protein LOC101419062 isoform X2 [Dasypus novemcinctus]
MWRTSSSSAPAGTMSGRQVGHSNTYSRLHHPNSASFPARPPGRTYCPSLPGPNSIKRSRTPSDSEFSSCSSPSERPTSPSSPSLPLGRICMGRPYNSKCVETSHLARRPAETRKPACRGNAPCLLRTSGPSGPSSPTFLDHLIKGINYLDRSASTFYSSCPQTSLSLPRLAANYLERAANSIPLDHLDHSPHRSYSNPSATEATPVQFSTNTCMVPSTKGASALQYMDESTNTSCTSEPSDRKLTPMLPQRPGIKLPELPWIGNGILSLGRLPRIWEAIRSGWRAPEPISKPAGWW